MKKFYAIILMLAAFSVAGMSQSLTRSTVIGTGFTSHAAMTFTAADKIITSDSLVISIKNPQKYQQHQVFTATLATVSGSPSVVITARGRVNSTDNWHPIGTAVTWTEAANNPVVISSTTPYNYNELKVSFVGSGAAQESKITAFDCKTANALQVPASSGTLTITRPTSGTVTLTAKDDDANGAFTVKAAGTGTLTLGQSTGATAITGSAVNVNASLNIATNINTGTSSGALSLGGGSGTVAVNSSSWDISTAGAATGLKSITSTADADNVVIDPYQDLHVIDVQVNSASKFSVDSTGAVTAAGGFVPPSASPLIWSQGGPTVLATAGTDTQPTAGSRYWVEVYIPYNVTLTGASYLIGSVGGTDSVVVQLCNSSGVQVATTKTTGATHGALVGTAANLQSVPFTTPYAAVAGKYFLAVQFSGNTCRFRTYPIPGSKFVASSAAGTWNTKADITPGTSFTADKGPIIRLY